MGLALPVGGRQRTETMDLERRLLSPMHVVLLATAYGAYAMLALQSGHQ